MTDNAKVLKADKCPYCGAKEPLIGTLARKQIEKGVNPQGLPGCLSRTEFVVASQPQTWLIGSRAPAGAVSMDVCMKCLGVYAVEVIIAEAVSTGQPGPRRRDDGS